MKEIYELLYGLFDLLGEEYKDTNIEFGLVRDDYEDGECKRITFTINNPKLKVK